MIQEYRFCNVFKKQLFDDTLYLQAKFYYMKQSTRKHQSLFTL